jgi:hypothetical protein
MLGFKKDPAGVGALAGSLSVWRQNASREMAALSSHLKVV